MEEKGNEQWKSAKRRKRRRWWGVQTPRVPHTVSRVICHQTERERRKKKARQGPRINTSLSDSEHLRERMREGGNQRKPQRERVRETRKKERKKGGAEWNG